MYLDDNRRHVSKDGLGEERRRGRDEAKGLHYGEWMEFRLSGKGEGRELEERDKLAPVFVVVDAKECKGGRLRKTSVRRVVNQGKQAKGEQPGEWGE